MAELSNQHKELVAADTRFPIPAAVSVCPYCGAALTASFEEWEKEDDDTWAGTNVTLDCATMPYPDDRAAFHTFLETHSVMPYVYWLPVCKTVEEWLNARYSFKM